MELRKITPEDWKLYRDFRLATLQSPDARAFGGSYEKESLWKEGEWRSLFDGSKPRFFYGFFDEDKLFSAAGAYQSEKDGAWVIMAVFTRPEWRGQGLSAQIMRTMLEVLASKGVGKVRLYVNSLQDSAVHLYEKIGFQKTDVIKDFLMGDGKTYDELVMEKYL